MVNEALADGFGDPANGADRPFSYSAALCHILSSSPIWTSFAWGKIWNI